MEVFFFFFKIYLFIIILFIRINVLCLFCTKQHWSPFFNFILFSNICNDLSCLQKRKLMGVSFLLLIKLYDSCILLHFGFVTPHPSVSFHCSDSLHHIHLQYFIIKHQNLKKQTTILKHFLTLNSFSQTIHICIHIYI